MSKIEKAQPSSPLTAGRIESSSPIVVNTKKEKAPATQDDDLQKKQAPKKQAEKNKKDPWSQIEIIETPVQERKRVHKEKYILALTFDCPRQYMTVFGQSFTKYVEAVQSRSGQGFDNRIPTQGGVAYYTEAKALQIRDEILRRGFRFSDMSLGYIGRVAETFILKNPDTGEDIDIHKYPLQEAEQYMGRFLCFEKADKCLKAVGAGQLQGFYDLPTVVARPASWPGAWERPMINEPEDGQVAEISDIRLNLPK